MDQILSAWRLTKHGLMVQDYLALYPQNPLYPQLQLQASVHFLSKQVN